jgi:hypothetical protein
LCPAVWARTCQLAVVQANAAKAEVHRKWQASSIRQYVPDSARASWCSPLEVSSVHCTPKIVQGFTEEEAGAKWNADHRDPSIKLTGTWGEH